MNVVRLADCHVRRLALHASDAAASTRSAQLIEDALRTASIHTGGAAGARVLVIRSLALGRISASATSATVALLLEDRLRELATRAISVRDSTAGNSDAVYFDDPLHAVSLLASRLAAHQPVDEWFWPLAVPGWTRELPRADALRAVLWSAFDVGLGTVGPAVVVQTVAQRGALDVLMSALRWQDGSELFRRSGWSAPPARVMPTRAPARVPQVALSAGARRSVHAWAWRLGARDARVHWVAAMLAIAEQPARAADVALPARVHALVHELLLATTSQPAADTALHADTVRKDSQPPPQHPVQAIGEVEGELGNVERPTPLPHQSTVTQHGTTAPLSKPATRRDTTARVADARTRTRKTTRAATRGAEHEDRRSAGDEPPQRARPDATAPQDDAGNAPPAPPAEFVPTQYAGIFYLLPLLRRLGVGQWLQDNPRLIELQFVARLLRHIAQRIGAPPDDAIYDALPVEPLDQTVAADLAPQLTEWTKTLRRWCHRNAQLGLVALGRRKGSLSWTRTHIDVHFTLRQIDLRVRMAGLDVDPGWLPWFGHVVSFHYEPEERPRG